MSESGDEEQPISGVLSEVEEAGGSERVTVGDIVDRASERSLTALLLVPALLLVSPLSGIPGSPTISALVIGLVAVQMVVGRRRLWLPTFLRDRQVPGGRLRQSTRFLRRPVGWVEPMIRPRLAVLTSSPARALVLVTCLAITLVMPVMEVLPMVASIAALAIVLFATGLMARDGVLVLLGYGVVVIAILVALALF